MVTSAWLGLALVRAVFYITSNFGTFRGQRGGSKQLLRMSSITSLDNDDERREIDALQGSSEISLVKDARRSTVYDAVAGHLTNDRFIRQVDFIPATRDTTSSSHVALPPGEALFRSSGAPVGDAEDSIYEQEQSLAPEQVLPTSDLLKAIHAYSSDYFAKTGDPSADVAYRSLDGSALLALGILLEESCNTMLGKSGYLALLEESTTVEAPESPSQGSIAPQRDDDGIQPPAKKQKT